MSQRQHSIAIEFYGFETLFTYLLKGYVSSVVIAEVSAPNSDWSRNRQVGNLNGSQNNTFFECPRPCHKSLYLIDMEDQKLFSWPDRVRKMSTVGDLCSKEAEELASEHLCTVVFDILWHVWTRIESFQRKNIALWHGARYSGHGCNSGLPSQNMLHTYSREWTNEANSDLHYFLDNHNFFSWIRNSTMPESVPNKVTDALQIDRFVLDTVFEGDILKATMNRYRPGSVTRRPSDPGSILLLAHGMGFRMSFLRTLVRYTWP